MHINKKKSLILPQATIYVFSVLYNVTRTKTGLDSTFDCVCVSQRPMYAIKLPDFNLGKDRRTDCVSTEI